WAILLPIGNGARGATSTCGSDARAGRASAGAAVVERGRCREGYVARVTPRRSGRGARALRALDPHLDAVQHRVARQRVEAVLLRESVAVRAGDRARDAQPHALLVVTPAVRQADHARHDVLG